MMVSTASTFRMALISGCMLMTPSLVDSDSVKSVLSTAVSRKLASISSMSRAVVVSAFISVSRRSSK